MEKKEVFDTSIAITKKEGIITVFTAIEYSTSLKKSFEILFPDKYDYIKAMIIAERLKEIGKPIGAIDILISSMCLNRSFKLITKDSDFNIIKTIFPEFDLQIIP